MPPQYTAICYVYLTLYTLCKRCTGGTFYSEDRKIHFCPAIHLCAVTCSDKAVMYVYSLYNNYLTLLPQAVKAN